LEEVQDALQGGQEVSQLTIEIDFTKSNEWTRKYSFDGKCLFSVEEK